MTDTDSPVEVWCPRCKTYLPYTEAKAAGISAGTFMRDHHATAHTKG